MNIDDIHHYNETFEKINIQKTMVKYFNIINDYLSYFHKNICLKEKKEYIMKRGVNIINYVFIFTLMYTKNIDLAIFHCKKAHYYYCEFIQQINQDIHSYLQLTSKDAAIFVYKKTIFKINNEYKKSHTLDNGEGSFLYKIRNLTGLINNIIFHCNVKKIKNIISRAKVIECLDVPIILINGMKNKDLNKDKYGNIIYKFLRKYPKIPISKNQLLKKINTKNFEHNIHSMESLKFVNWLFV